MVSLKIQSVMLYITVLSVNLGIFSLVVLFSNNYWYTFIPILALGAATTLWYMLWIILHSIARCFKKIVLTAPDEPMMFLITAYRETKEELDRTIESITTQKFKTDIQRVVVIIVDGEKETAQAIRRGVYDDTVFIENAYEDWHDKPKNVTIFKKVHNGIDLVYIIKSENAGKRDSVVLARTLAYGRLFEDVDEKHALKISGELELAWLKFVPKVTRMIGIDADTIFHEDCSQALLEEMNYPGDRPVDGVVGYIDVDKGINKSPYQTVWIWFQNVGYIIGQHVMRAYQSRISEKVSCLSGACYGIYIPTMCEPKLLKEFNTPPPQNAGLFLSILGYASEDRRSVVLALCRDRKVRFRQALDKRAIAYTIPPDSFTVFISQRRRWSLGTASNNLWLFLYGKNLFISERVVALTQVVGFALSPLYLMVNAFLIYTMINKFDLMLIYISIPMFMVYLNNLLIPMWSPCMGSFANRVSYYPKLFITFFYSPWISVIIQTNSILKSWSVSWGKTVVKTKQTETV